MKKKEKVMVVSPHFDDAILSCGGMLCSDEWFDSEISVINVFTEISQKKQKMSDVIAEYVSEDLAISKSKVNLDMCERWIATRRKEELFATKTLGIKSFDLGYKDAIFRMVNDKFIYDTEEKLFLGQVRENVLLEQLVHQFIDICKNYSICYFPAGIGNHPDHIILHLIGKKIQCNHPSVRFYCEIPYSKDRKEEGKMYEINEVNYERKISAVCEYKTQINWLLKNEKNIEKIISAEKGNSMCIEEFRNLIIYLICDGLGESAESIIAQQEEKGFIELEKLDFLQIISKLEGMLDITTGWLEHNDYRINLNKLCDRVNEILN